VAGPVVSPACGTLCSPASRARVKYGSNCARPTPAQFGGAGPAGFQPGQQVVAGHAVEQVVVRRHGDFGGAAVVRGEIRRQARDEGVDVVAVAHE